MGLGAYPVTRSVGLPNQTLCLPQHFHISMDLSPSVQLAAITLDYVDKEASIQVLEMHWAM